jgi:hypothetical protein
MFCWQSSVVPPKDQTCLRIQRIEAERRERRIAMDKVGTSAFSFLTEITPSVLIVAIILYFRKYVYLGI